jgi:hypothetical protein
MVSNERAAHLLESNKHEITAVKIVTGRRGVLKTFALTAATGAIGLASAAAKPAAAAYDQVTAA